MARARRFGGGARRGSKRLTEWSSLGAQNYVAVANAGATLISSVAFEDPGTIVRARGLISVKVENPALDNDIAGAFGIGLVTAEAFGIGITAVPEPFSDADWGGWMVWQPFGFHWEHFDSTGAGKESWEFEINSKAMRKVEPNTNMVFVAESQSGAFRLAEYVRLLLMLH